MIGCILEIKKSTLLQRNVPGTCYLKVAIRRRVARCNICIRGYVYWSKCCCVRVFLETEVVLRWGENDSCKQNNLFELLSIVIISSNKKNFLIYITKLQLLSVCLFVCLCVCLFVCLCVVFLFIC